MRRLIQFLVKFRDFLIFAALQFIFLTIFFNTRNYHRAKMANTSSAVVGWFMEKKHNVSKHFSLEDQNLALLNEVAELKRQVPSSFYELQNKVFRVDGKLSEQQYTYLPAIVINSTSNKRDNYVTINKGKIQGIAEGMGVITDDGAVGRIVDVSDHYALVKTILSDEIRLGVKAAKNNEYWFMNWEGNDNTVTRIDNVKRDIDVEVGDSVVTRGGNGRFPAGVMVGEVYEIISEDGSPQVSIRVKLSVSFTSLYHVYVIKNAFLEEQKKLEERTEEIDA